MKSKMFVIIFLLFVLIANISCASYSTVTMTVVEEPVCSIEFGENSKFEKKLISKDLNNKEVTLQLKVTNEEISTKPTGEVVLVIDNSNSMKQSTSSGKTRSELIKSSANTLVTNLLKDNTNLKIGAVSFSSSSEKNTDGYIILGTEKDSTLLTNLTSDISTLTTAINNITYAEDTVASYTNLQAGLNNGKKLFTNEKNNKYLIVLTDGVPNVILNRNAVKYDEETITATKKEYISIVTDGITPITMLSGIEDGNASLNNTYTYNQYIESIFGTSKNPTAGNFYYVTDDKIEATITNDIYKDLLPLNKSFTNIKIVDYFPKEIIDNFDFSYVTKANIGNITAEVDKTNNSITWTIPELAIGETATVQYKLKLKENFDSKIVGKILDTNEKVDLSYNDFDSNVQNKTSDVTPKLKLTEPPAVLPKAGITTLIVIFGAFAIGLLVFSITKLTIINKNMK